LSTFSGGNAGYYMGINNGGGVTESLYIEHRNQTNSICGDFLYNLYTLLGTPFIISEVYNNSTTPKSTAYIANSSVDTSVDSNTSVSSSPASALYIGTNVSNPIANDANFRGYIGEVVIYDKALNSTERTNVYNFLKAKWGL
jgi:hypothetical protein